MTGPQNRIERQAGQVRSGRGGASFRVDSSPSSESGEELVDAGQAFHRLLDLVPVADPDVSPDPEVGAGRDEDRLLEAEAVEERRGSNGEAVPDEDDRPGERRDRL